MGNFIGLLANPIRQNYLVPWLFTGNKGFKFLPLRIFETALNHIFINRAFIGIRHGGHIVGTFSASFYL